MECIVEMGKNSKLTKGHTVDNIMPYRLNLGLITLVNVISHICFFVRHFHISNSQLRYVRAKSKFPSHNYDLEVDRVAIYK